jgi:hypothetical protein
LLDHKIVSVAQMGASEVCYVRRRRVWSFGSRVVFEAVGTRRHQLEVLAATRPVPGESAAAAAALLELDRDLQSAGWRPLGEQRTLGQYVVTCYTRPARPKKAA